MQLPIRAGLKFQAQIDAEETAQDTALSLTRRISMLSKSLATAPVSEHASTEAEIARLRDKLDVAQKRHRTIADQNARLRHFLQSIGPVSLEDAKTKPAKIDKNETLALAAARIRARIVALTSERRKVERCALPIADAKKQAAEHVAALVERGKPTIAFGHGVPFRATFAANVEGANTPRPDIAAALAWLDPSALLQRLCEDVEAQPTLALAMSPKARAEKLTALEAELLVLEFEDEAIVEASEIEGPVIVRRPDCSVLALLGITINRGKQAPAKSAAKVDRIKAADPQPTNPKRMTEAELIEAFGANRLPGLEG